MDDDVHGPSRDWLAGGSRHDLSRVRILDAATQLIAERGAAQLSAEDVCARVGCSRATLYRHVGGRPAIMAAVVSQRVIPVTAAVNHASAPFTGHARVVETILATVMGIRADPILLDALEHIDREQMSEYLTVPESIAPVDSYTPPYAPDDRIAAKMLARIIWSLVDYPLANPEEERHIATRFARAFAPGPSAGGDDEQSLGQPE